MVLFIPNENIFTFIQENAPASRLRSFRDSKDPIGFSKELWAEMAELGWAGTTLPEEFGGMGLGYVELGAILEECGRTLTAHPIVSSVVLAAECLLRGGTATQREQHLPAVGAGDRLHLEREIVDAPCQHTGGPEP